MNPAALYLDILLTQYKIIHTSEQAQQLVEHLELVLETNKYLNLTRITDLHEACVLHTLDSLLPLSSELCNIDNSSKVLDMGTGGGFPGLPIAIVTGATVTCIDSVKKKITAVQSFVDRLALSRVTPSARRLEEIQNDEKGIYTHVFARAVAQSNVLIEYAAPYLAQDGLLILEKGKPTEEEIALANTAADLCGLEYVSRETYELPEGSGTREILYYKKVRKPKIKLPRKIGMAKHHPLGV